MAKRRKLHEVSLEDDIRYRGPISFQGFQVLGWLCLVASVAMVLLNKAREIDPLTKEMTEGIVPIVSTAAALSLPFLLIANFSRILSNFEGYKKQLIRTGGGALGIAAGFYFIYSRYFAGTLALLLPDPDQMTEIIEGIVREMTKTGFIAFNVFVDLFLCALFMYFLNARPKRVFTGKKVLFLRFCALLPIAYEVISISLKWMSASGDIVLPVWSYPLLTVKPPMTFLLFMLLALHVKTREHRFRKHGRSHEEYLEYLNTNRNSLHFSFWLIFLMIVTAILDVLALLVITVLTAESTGVLESEERITEIAESAAAVGFGQTIPQLFLIPLMFLYSYSRIPRNKMFGMLIPVIGIGLMVLVVLEFGYQALSIYIPQLKEAAQASLDDPEVLQLLQTLQMMNGAGP